MGGYREDRLLAAGGQGRRRLAWSAAGGQARQHGGMGGLARQPSRRGRRGIAGRGSGEVMSMAARGRERLACASESRGRGEGSGDPRVGDSNWIWLIANGELGKWLLLDGPHL
jgi:hypothetical protein